MNNLQEQVADYLKTLDFGFLEQTEDILVADKVDFGGARDTRLIWIPSEPEHEWDIPNIERRLVREFEEKTDRYPNARCWIIAYTFGGFSQEFHAAAAQHNVLLRVPIQFFDTPFKYEEAPQIRSAIKELRNPVARIPQSYSLLVNGESQEGGDDLLEHLWDEFRLSREPSLHIVVGPAGIGKTWLFRALFSRLYKYFLDQKSRLEIFPRPIPLIPAYLQQTEALRTQELFRSFIETEVASPVRLATFKWMVTQGYVSWLFDGLDELYAEDLDFFYELAELLTRPDNRARVLVCARESLLTSCETFTEFLNDYGADPAIRIYRLEGWEHQSKVAFARLCFDPPRDSRFVNYISSSDSLRSLSSLPYYCDLLRIGFEEEELNDFADDFALIDYTISQIVEREKGKGLLKSEDFLPNGLNEWLETVASEFFATDFRGVDKVNVETYAKLVLDPDLSEAEWQKAVTTLVQFPLFAPGVEPGVLAFEHELIAEYLAGCYWSRRLSDDPCRVGRELGERPDFADSLIARYISNQLSDQPQGIKRLTDALRIKAPPDRTFVNLLQLILLATPAKDALAMLRNFMKERDLSQVRFEERDLERYSFRNCNLSNVVFRECNLRSSKFEGARLAETRFENLTQEDLQEAQFGDLSRFESVYVGGKRIDSRPAFAEWARKMTGQTPPILEPCPSAHQLRTLFLKFVRPDGSGRRNELSMRALTRGKRYSEAPNPEDFVKASLSFGYLQDLRWHNHIRRVPGDRYNDVINFVTDWQLTDDLKSLLDSVCPETHCEHVPQPH